MHYAIRNGLIFFIKEIYNMINFLKGNYNCFELLANLEDCDLNIPDIDGITSISLFC